MTVRNFKALLEWDPEARVWVSYVPTLDYLSTFGENREEAIQNTREAILGYLEAAAKEGLPVPVGASEAELVDVEVAIALLDFLESAAGSCSRRSTAADFSSRTSVAATITCASPARQRWS